MHSFAHSYACIQDGSLKRSVHTSSICPEKRGNGRLSIYKFPLSTACEARHNCFSAPVMFLGGY